MTAPAWEVRQGEWVELLRGLESDSVDCVVTSPPYWGLRDYGLGADQLGLEPHPSQWLEHLWAGFDEVRRVLKPTGTCWVNLGETYGSGRGEPMPNTSQHRGYMAATFPTDGTWLRPKQLLMLPARFAIGMQERQWLLRNDICWHKPNAMPASVRDRFSCTWEHVFLFVKEPRYAFDLDAVRVEHKEPERSGKLESRNPHSGRLDDPDKQQAAFTVGIREYNPLGKNPGDHWDIPTFAFPEAHFATYPPDLVRRCVRAGCPSRVCAECGKPWETTSEPTPEHTALKQGKRGTWHQQREREAEVGAAAGWGQDKPRVTASYVITGSTPTCTCSAATQPGLVLDPFCGSGTTGWVAVAEGRCFLGFDLSEEYCAMARCRIALAQPPLPLLDNPSPPE